MEQKTHTLNKQTNGPGLYDITRQIVDWCRQQGIAQGLLTLFIRHTSAGPRELLGIGVEARRKPRNGPYRHTCEGSDDMPAHIKTALTQTQLTIPVQDSCPVLGTWQGIYLFEHRDRSHNRQVTMHLLGE